MNMRGVVSPATLSRMSIVRQVRRTSIAAVQHNHRPRVPNHPVMSQAKVRRTSKTSVYGYAKTRRRPRRNGPHGGWWRSFANKAGNASRRGTCCGWTARGWAPLLTSTRRWPGSKKAMASARLTRPRTRKGGGRNGSFSSIRRFMGAEMTRWLQAAKQASDAGTKPTEPTEPKARLPNVAPETTGRGVLSVSSVLSGARNPRGTPAPAHAFTHGTSPGGRPVTWTGRVISLDEWRALSDWQRHGPRGAHWNATSGRWEGASDD
jgi:hypothetical protein